MVECTVKRVSSEELIPLRAQVLRPHHPLMESVFAGDGHPLAGHYGIASVPGSKSPLLSVGTIYPERPPAGLLSQRVSSFAQEHEVWRLRGMATDESARGQGLGEKVLRACITHVRERNGLMIWANARTPAVAFYRRSGFEVVGEEYSMPGIGPHYLICLIL